MSENTHVFETPGSVALQIKLPTGRVVVTTSDEPRTTVELVPLGRRGADALEGIEVRAEQRAGGHVIVIDEKDRIRWGPIRISWSGDVEARVRCPEGADLDFSGASTDLRVEGELGEVAAKTASGDIKLESVRKRLQVKTASGDVYVGGIGDVGSVVTVSGDLGVGTVDAPLTARTVSGDVHVGFSHAALALATTSGDVNVEAVGAGEVRLQSVSGDARIGVSRGTRVWIDASSVSGDLDSQLGLADEPGEGDPEEPREVVPLHVKTISGDVTIVRAALVAD
jgi:DUF4097 and DUF4098 domain-containing protein YvlB